ncbi:MAG: hypothetical protein L6R41_000639 [Letrouitia leprolyta]|nr:MAG: hypothetical protein L6R41_000639 [Letrouitia leprolyta]
MASSVTKNQYQNDKRWVWKIVVRVIGIVIALVGMGCVAWILYKLRQWKNIHEDGDYQADEFILPWLLFSLTLSLVYNAANILMVFSHHSNLLTRTATITCDLLLAVSLLASGIWLSLAATTAIDGNTALDIHFYARNSSFAYSLTVKGAIVIISITLTFLAALLHTPLFISAAHSAFLSRRHHANAYTHHDNFPPISHKLNDIGYESEGLHHHHHLLHQQHQPLPLHPAYRSPLPYPNPNHPTSPYPNAQIPHPLAPAPALRYQHQASPTGVHAKCESVGSSRGSELEIKCYGLGVDMEAGKEVHEGPKMGW